MVKITNMPIAMKAILLKLNFYRTRFEIPFSTNREIIPEKTQFIIGSQSIYTNDTYFTTELKHINSIENIRKKRNFDIYTAFILVIISIGFC